MATSVLPSDKPTHNALTLDDAVWALAETIEPREPPKIRTFKSVRPKVSAQVGAPATAQDSEPKTSEWATAYKTKSKLAKTSSFSTAVQVTAGNPAVAGKSKTPLLYMSLQRKASFSRRARSYEAKLERKPREEEEAERRMDLTSSISMQESVQ
ncbi:unnamed protein product [Zymoseptoria tritici ST99CH_1A5]|uniref:Uncharacterized protein n=1 Tax=Zymoseptoria tritici ST99CH_1A5 TaxID=1276529 RepID=A0A1Y6L7F2_ZYMTR|nr:unnamed protein product [Zymoseptoria tritici ST99CH_1A5]